MYAWVPLLSTWNYNDIVNQLYTNTKEKVCLFVYLFLIKKQWILLPTSHFQWPDPAPLAPHPTLLENG